MLKHRIYSLKRVVLQWGVAYAVRGAGATVGGRYCGLGLVGRLGPAGYAGCLRRGCTTRMDSVVVCAIASSFTCAAASGCDLFVATPWRNQHFGGCWQRS